MDALYDAYTDNLTARVAPKPTDNIGSSIKFHNRTAVCDAVTRHTVPTMFVYDLAPTNAKSLSYGNALYFGPIGQGKSFIRDFDTFDERYDDV